MNPADFFPAAAVCVATGFLVGWLGCYLLMLRDMRSRYDAGWVDRGIADWHKDKDRRNKAGQFRPKSQRTQ